MKKTIVLKIGIPVIVVVFLIVVSSILIVVFSSSSQQLQEEMANSTSKLDCSNQELIYDGICDDITNHENCGFDGGDCCWTLFIDLTCQDCLCHPQGVKLSQNDTNVTQPRYIFPMVSYLPTTMSIQTTESIPIITTTSSLLTSTPFDFRDCEYELWVGDEWCDDTQTANNAQCNFDGGDCCGPDWSLEYTYCDDCQCLLPDCPEWDHEYLGDGFCDDDLNTPECFYDKEDCCGTCIDKSHCSQCQCHHWPYRCPHDFQIIGDGICDDLANNINCDFDRGDCCDSTNDFSLCIDCECLESCDK